MPDVAESLKPNTRRAREPARSPAPDSPAAVGRRTGAGWSAAVATRRHPEPAAPEPIDRAAPHGIARCARTAAWRACAADALTPLRRTEGTDSRWSPSTARCTSSAASRTNRTAQPIIRTLINVIRALISVLRALVTVVRSFIAVIRAPFTVIRALIAVIRTRTEAGGVIRVVRHSLCQTERRVGYRAVWDTTQAQVQVLE